MCLEVTMDPILVRMSEKDLPIGAPVRIIVVSPGSLDIPVLLERMRSVELDRLPIDPVVIGSVRQAGCAIEPDMTDLSAEALRVAIARLPVFKPEVAPLAPTRDPNFWFKGRKRRKGWRPWY